MSIKRIIKEKKLYHYIFYVFEKLGQIFDCDHRIS